jgi:diguanylate cyclase (GGDEF)-like protein/PAS domain S-box-containing protein
MGSTSDPRAAVALTEGPYHVSLAETLDELPERVIRYRLSDLTILYCNVAWAAGHDLEPAEAIGRPLDDLLTEAELTGLRSQLALLGPDNPRIADDTPREAPNAPGEWVEWVDQYLPGNGHGPEVLAVGRDVSGRHTAELNLAASESRFRELADKSADVVWRFVLEPVPHFDYLSPSVERVLGYPPEYFIEDFTRFLDILDDDTRDAVDRALNGELLPERMDFHYRHADGSTAIGEMQITVLRGGLQGVSRDVTELRRLQADLAELALRDPLTGLANRRLFKELLEADLERARRNGQPLAVAYLDLNDFKLVNDTYGHEAGDTVLCETARRLRANVRGADNVARLGGDEFVIVYQATPEDATHLLDRIDRALAAPITVSADVTVECSASIGSSDTNLVGYDAGALLAAADTAMYEVKRTRREQADAATPAAG